MKQDTASLRQVKGVIHHTESFGAVDGPGLRFVLFLRGCPLRCLYCHNPDALPFSGGTLWTAGEALDHILRYKNFIKNGGVTFSGGEPLAQADFVAALSQLLHGEGIHVAIDTSGCEPLPYARHAIDEADLLLLDIKAADPELCRRLTGMDNANALLTLDYCESTGKPVWVRHVLLRGYTLDPAQWELLAQQLAPYRCIQRLELLPFHKLGEPKWEQVRMSYQLKDTPATTQEELAEAKAFFAARGFNVQ